MSVDVSVVVCTNDEGRWSKLIDALQSLEEQSIAAREVIVVVDHNSSVLKRARNELENAVVIDNTEERGLGGARNAGVKAARASVVAFLDDDAVASRDWVALLAKEYRDPLVVGVGGAAEPVWAQGRPRWFPAEFDWVVGCTYRGMPETTREVRNLMGCNMSYRREILLSAGLFRLGYGCDETELCIRLRQHARDRLLLHVPEAKVFHHVPSSRGRFRRYLSRCFFEGGSKAVVSRLVGAQDGLASERLYTLHVLPAAVGRGVVDFLSGRDAAGIARASAVLAGLAATSAGYIIGRLSLTRAARMRGWQGEKLSEA